MESLRIDLPGRGERVAEDRSADEAGLDAPSARLRELGQPGTRVPPVLLGGQQVEADGERERSRGVERAPAVRGAVLEEERVERPLREAVVVRRLVGGGDEGFFAGHVAATIVWIGVAAALLRHAVRLPRAERSVAVGGGMALVAAAMCKLFVFDLGTLDGIFRVMVFIVVGLVYMITIGVLQR